MGMSNYLPSSRISQSGVCTSSTRPASPFEGQVIYETDTDRVLVWNASAWVAPNSQTANPPGLELITQVSLSSNVTQVPLVFSNTYRDYLVTLNGVGTSSASAIWYRMLNGTTPAAGNYYYSFLGLDSGGGSQNVSQANFSQGYAGMNTPSSAQSVGDSRLHFRAPFVATASRVQIEGVYLGSAVYSFRTGQCSHDLANAYNGFEILTTTAVTFNSGTVTVYGYRN
jgi:hypothetical protein